MSTFDGFQRMGASEYPLSSVLVSYIRSGESYQCATPARYVTDNRHLNLITFLAIAQNLKVDFLPITWQPALDTVGRGATAEINQSFVNPQWSFAFKRFSLPKTSEENVRRAFESLITEVLVLAHPAIRHHPNIINLEGICWDIPPDSDRVWPVLVFEKTEYGDLFRFMDSDTGKRIGFHDRLKLCGDIAAAVMVMHSCGIIHGDIKPQNVAVFQNDAGGYVANLIDFGYSSGFMGADIIMVPRSRPWDAPEYHSRGFKRAAAMKMDAYSFGMLCLWLLFNERFSEPVIIPLDSNNREKGIVHFSKATVEHATNRRDFLAELKSKDKVVEFSSQFVLATDALDDEETSDLIRFFSATLALDPNSRSADFNQLSKLLGQERNTLPPTPELLEGALFSIHADFQIEQSIYQLCMADYRVRSHISTSLEAQASPPSGKPRCETCSREAAFQLAFCYKLGFGVTQNDQNCDTMLSKSMRPSEELKHSINTLKEDASGDNYSNNKFRELSRLGYVKTVDFANYYGNQVQIDGIEVECKREIASVELALGDTHLAVSILKTTLASILHGKGDWTTAEGLFAQVVEMRKKRLGPEHHFTLNAMARLSGTYFSQGRWAESAVLDKEAWELRKRVFGEDHPETITCMSNLASSVSRTGRWKEAEMLFAQVIELAKRVLGVNHRDTLTHVANMALAISNQGRWHEALALEVQVADARKRVLGEDHSDTITSIANLAATCLELGRFREAEESLQQVMETSLRVLGRDHPSTLTSMSTLALVYGGLGRYNEAEEFEVQVAERKSIALGPDHPFTLNAIGNLALTRSRQGRWKAAEELQVRVIERCQSLLGDDHPTTLTGMANLAVTLVDQGRWKEAEKMERKVIHTRKRKLGEEHPDTIKSMSNLASSLGGLRRWREAEALFVQVLETRKRVLGKEHPDTLASMASLAATLSSQKRWHEARVLFSKVAEVRPRVLGEEHPDTLHNITNMAMAYWNEGQRVEGLDLAAKSVEKHSRVLGREHPDTLSATANLGSMYRDQRRFRDAEELLSEVVQASLHVLGQENPSTLSSMELLGSTYREEGRWKDAEEIFAKTFKLRKALMGEEHPATLNSMMNLASSILNQGRKGEAYPLILQYSKLRKMAEEQETAS